MKIGLVCPYNIMRGGGVQECVLAMQTELISRGHEVLVITPRPRDHKAAETKNLRFVGAATDVKSPFHTTAQVSMSNGMDAVEKLLETEKFDVLHFHEPWVPALSRQLLGRSEAVNIATFHAKFPDTVMSRTIEKIITPYTKSILKYFSALTACSEAAASYADGITHKEIQIIPNGIDIKKFKPSGLVKKDHSILYIGRLEKRKGVRYLLEAFDMLAEKDHTVKLIVAGDGPDRLKLELFVKENHIPRVEFLGYIEEKKKLELMQKATIFCSPALYGESFGIVLLEAMAAGTPIVAGNNRGYVEVMKKRGALSIVNPRDVTEFTRRLELLLNDSAVRDLMLDWSNKYVQDFDYPKIVDQYEALYKQLTK